MPFDLQVNYNNTAYTIHSSSKVNYLGVMLQSNLYLDNHIQSIQPELRRQSLLLRGLCFNSPPKIYRQVCISTIRTKAMYCGHLLTDSTNFKKLERLQSMNLRYILRALCTSPVVTMQAALKLPSLEDLSNYMKACFILHADRSGCELRDNLPQVYTPVDKAK